MKRAHTIQGRSYNSPISIVTKVVYSTQGLGNGSDLQSYHGPRSKCFEVDKGFGCH